MTATAASLPTLDISGTPRVPFGRLVKVELRKSYDTRAGFWLLMTIGILVVLAETIALLVTTINNEAMSWGDFVAVAAYLTGLLLPVLGIMLMTTEWSQRSAMVTFSLEPHRPRVIAAKYLVGVILTLLTAAVAIAIGLICNVIYGLAEGGSDWHFGMDGLFGFLITQTLSMTIGFALAALLLNTAAAIVLYFVYKFVLPFVFGIASFYLDWFDNASKWFDFERAQAPIFEMSVNTGAEWGHLLVSGFIWLVIPLTIGLNRILRAEVK